MYSIWLKTKMVILLVMKKTLRYLCPMVDTTAAVNPITMASHGWWTADMETPIATPPARVHRCIWIWQRSEDIKNQIMQTPSILTDIILGKISRSQGRHLPIQSSSLWYMFRISGVRSYQVEFSLGTGEHGHGSCCYRTDSQGQVGAANGLELPPSATIIYKHRVKTGPKHPEEHSPCRTENRVSILFSGWRTAIPPAAQQTPLAVTPEKLLVLHTQHGE